MKGMQGAINKVEQAIGIKSGKQDAVSILKADHDKAQADIKQWLGLRSSQKKQALLNQIIKELSIHSSVEEDLVYPILEDSSQKKISERTLEAEEEHHLLKIALAELADTKINAETLRAKVTVVQELVKHHIKEEESTLLPALKRSGADLERLGHQILQRKQALMSDVSRGGGIGKNKDRTALATTSRSRSVGKSTGKKASAGRSRASKVKAVSTKRSASTGRKTSSAGARSRSTSRSSTSRRKSA